MSGSLIFIFLSASGSRADPFWSVGRLVGLVDLTDHVGVG